MEWLTTKQAVQHTGKSPTALRRLIAKYKVPIKKQGKASNSPMLISRRHLLAACAESAPSDAPVDAPVVAPAVHQVNNEVVDMLKERVKRLEDEKAELKKDLAQARQENRALQEEVKALLRQGKQPSKGIFGFIVDQVWRDRK